MALQHHQFNGYEFEQTLGDSEGGDSEVRSLVCCSPWGHKELDTTQQLNNIKWFFSFYSGRVLVKGVDRNVENICYLVIYQKQFVLADGQVIISVVVF